MSREIGWGHEGWPPYRVWCSPSLPVVRTQLWCHSALGPDSQFSMASSVLGFHCYHFSLYLQTWLKSFHVSARGDCEEIWLHCASRRSALTLSQLWPCSREKCDDLILLVLNLKYQLCLFHDTGQKGSTKKHLKKKPLLSPTYCYFPHILEILR